MKIIGKDIYFPENDRGCYTVIKHRGKPLANGVFTVAVEHDYHKDREFLLELPIVDGIVKFPDQMPMKAGSYVYDITSDTVVDDFEQHITVGQGKFIITEVYHADV